MGTQFGYYLKGSDGRVNCDFITSLSRMYRAAEPNIYMLQSEANDRFNTASKIIGLTLTLHW